jgi:hypothetical protein
VSMVVDRTQDQCRDALQAANYIRCWRSRLKRKLHALGRRDACHHVARPAGRDPAGARHDEGPHAAAGDTELGGRQGEHADERRPPVALEDDLGLV